MKNKNRKFYTLLLISLLCLVLSFGGIYKYLSYRESIKVSPYDVLISDIYSDSVTISWKTVTETPSYIKLGDSNKLFGNKDLTNSHRITLSGLKESSKYSFVISDGSRTWNNPLEGSNTLKRYTLTKFEFFTLKPKDDIQLPEVEEINALPNELVYIVLKNNDTYSDVRSYQANRFGGITIDKNSFAIPNQDTEIINIEYFSSKQLSSSNMYALAADINCNQNVSPQSIDGVSKEGFADLATRWTAGRGKNYALECFNDVVYRAKAKGVDPAFALTIWLNESGASNYTQGSNSGGAYDFGIEGIESVPAKDFSKQLDYFLSLTHNASCQGLSYWEAWGNMYRWGSCNTDDPVKRQVGIDYYKEIETVYGWVTNGRKLPDKVTGLPASSGGNGGSTEWGGTNGSLCCAIKLNNQEQLQGDYENDVAGKTCNDVWAKGRSVYGGTIEYAVEIPGKTENACQIKYDGVCCQTSTGPKWLPKLTCTQAIPNISNSKDCLNVQVEKACFFTDGKYQWLPKSFSNNSIQGVTDQSACEARNKLNTYKITLQKGINFIGFDFNPVYKGSPMLASNLVENSTNILLVGNFKGYEWKDLIKKSEKLPFAGNDFYFEQNKGYLIISDNSSVIEISGWKDSSTKYTQLDNGWNLVGGYIYTKSYKASTLIKSLKENSISVNTVGLWNTQTGMFNYMKQDGSNVYGEDLQLKSSDGIFLRMSQ